LFLGFQLFSLIITGVAAHGDAVSVSRARTTRLRNLARLLALGLRPNIRKFFLREAQALAVYGGAIGVVGGIFVCKSDVARAGHVWA